MVRRSARRGDIRLDAALLAGALLVSIVARALPEIRSDTIGSVLRRSVFVPLVALQSRAERARRAMTAEDSLTLAGDSALLRGLDARALVNEDTRLRKLVGLGTKLRDGFVAAEALHGPAMGEAYTMVLNAGTRAGVDSFSPVIAPEGIVGYVRSADGMSSVAIVWPHPDFRVSGMSDKGSAIGMVSAHVGDGASRFMLELRGVSFRTPLAIGTRIVSSGVGGTFPRGIPIGTIVSQLPSAEGWARNYLVLPSVHPADIGTVLVLLRTRTRPDLSSVWAQPDSAAATTKRMVANGDSLAKAAAQAKDTVLVVLHFSLRPLLDWRVALDFLVIGVLLVSVRVRPGAAAVLGCVAGLAADAVGAAPLGSAALAMTVVAFAASWLKASFFAENVLLNGLFLFGAKLGFDALFLLVERRLSGVALVAQIGFWSVLSAALTALAGLAILVLFRPVVEPEGSRL
jgi:rod shape-determining protein MreD